MPQSVWAVLVAAGRGERLGADRPKAFVRLGDLPLLAESLRRLDDSPSIDGIVIVGLGKHIDENAPGFFGRIAENLHFRNGAVGATTHVGFRRVDARLYEAQVRELLAEK